MPWSAPLPGNTTTTAAAAEAVEAVTVVAAVVAAVVVVEEVEGEILPAAEVTALWRLPLILVVEVEVALMVRRVSATISDFMCVMVV